MLSQLLEAVSKILDLFKNKSAKDAANRAVTRSDNRILRLMRKKDRMDRARERASKKNTGP